MLLGVTMVCSRRFGTPSRIRILITRVVYQWVNDGLLKPPWYPNLRLCAPVTYDADARRLASVPINECSNPPRPGPGPWGNRKFRFGISPPCSVTWIIWLLWVPSLRTPWRNRAWYMPQPASSSSRLETGDDQEA